MTASSKLSDLFRQLVARMGKQEALAEKLKCTTSNLSQIVKATTIPEPETLAGWSPVISEILGIPDRSLFPVLYHYQAHDRLLRMLEKNGHGDHVRQALLGYGEVLKKIETDFPQLRGATLPQRRLAKMLISFPEAFEPLTIVTGDRRETPPKSAGDIGAFSSSSCDDKYLGELRLPKGTTKISDKIFVQTDEQILRQRFGERNLLVIGSPASNHLARIINKTSIFRFNLDVQAVDDLGKTMHEARGKNSHDLKALQEQKLDFLKYVMKRMFFGGLFDPTYQYFFRASTLSEYRDYGVVSLARNPYSEDARHVCILVGGLHLPGTMFGVDLLSRPDEFRHHPFGGIYQIDLANVSWEARMERSAVTFSWERREDPPDEVRAIEDGLSSFRQGTSPSRDELDGTLEFLRQLVRMNSDADSV